MKGSTRTLAVVAAAAALILTTAAAARPKHDTPRADRFGYTLVRRGIPRDVHRLDVSSPDVRAGAPLPASAWANQFGCTGGNQQPRVHWTAAGAATRSYAVRMFDRDAPTGSGFWHWLVWDIPAGDTSLTSTLPAGAIAGTNDAGIVGYLGPCPPAGDRTHHYEITVLALDVPTLDLPSSTPPAVAAFTMSTHVVAFGRLTVTARQPATA